MSEHEAIQLVEKALEYGINFIDTAPNTGEVQVRNAWVKR